MSNKDRVYCLLNVYTNTISLLFLLSHRFIDVISNTRQWCTVSAINRTGSLSTYFSTSRYKVLDRVD